jgi:hypothetical protein
MAMTASQRLFNVTEEFRIRGERGSRVMKTGEKVWAEWPLPTGEVTVYLDLIPFRAKREEFDSSVAPASKWPTDSER